MPSDSNLELGPSDPMVEALVASARRLGSEAQRESPEQRAERETRIWTSVTRVTAAGPSAATSSRRAGWLWAALLAVACAGAGAALTWFLLR